MTAVVVVRFENQVPLLVELMNERFVILGRLKMGYNEQAIADTLLYLSSKETQKLSARLEVSIDKVVRT
jgi:hypothetical protein